MAGNGTSITVDLPKDLIDRILEKLTEASGKQIESEVNFVKKDEDDEENYTNDYISRQDAVDAFYLHLCRDAGNSREAAISFAGCKKILASLPSVESMPQWIPCSERLPKEEKESYWVCTDGGYQHECRWTNTNPLWTHLTTNWHWNIFDIPQYSKVVAWMPLPEPWKGEEK